MNINQGINEGVKFSYNIVKGTVQQRQKNAALLTDKVFNNLSSRIKSDEILLNDIYTSLKINMPEYKPIKFVREKNIKDSREGSIDYLVENDIPVAQVISVPMKKGKMKSLQLPTLMHELTHAVDILFNPKYTARTNRMAKQKLYDEKYIKCFDNALYHLEEFSNNAEKEKVLKQRKLDIEDWLKDKTPEEKIDCIQEVRYALLMEDNAYRTEKKYTDIMRRNNLKTSDYDKEIDKYLFKEKAELLKQMGFETIKKEREKLIK